MLRRKRVLTTTNCFFAASRLSSSSVTTTFFRLVRSLPENLKKPIPRMCVALHMSTFFSYLVFHTFGILYHLTNYYVDKR
ncbi:unnamed protein product [Ectocarpus sp. 8 AP-2014]